MPSYRTSSVCFLASVSHSLFYDRIYVDADVYTFILSKCGLCRYDLKQGESIAAIAQHRFKYDMRDWFWGLCFTFDMHADVCFFPSSLR